MIFKARFLTVDIVQIEKYLCKNTVYKILLTSFAISSRYKTVSGWLSG